MIRVPQQLGVQSTTEEVLHIKCLPPCLVSKNGVSRYNG